VDDDDLTSEGCKPEAAAVCGTALHCRALVVDDEPDSLASLLEVLGPWAERECLEIHTTASGEEAALRVRELGGELDLIICDLRMPGISPWELRKAVSREYPDLLFVLVGSYSQSELVSAIEAGFFSYVIKPWQPDYLLAELGKALRFVKNRNQLKRHTAFLDEELRWGGELQRRLLQVELPQPGRFCVRHLYLPLPGLHCGGDYYDVVRLSDKRYAFLIGDVSGHGIKGAFVTTMLKTMIYREYIRRHLNEFDPADFLGWLNERVFYELRMVPDLVVTFFVGVLDLDRSEYTYANAGHPAALRFGFDADAGRLIFRERLQVHGAGFGLLSDAAYEARTVKLEENDVVLQVTDGLTELRRPDGGVEDVELERWLTSFEGSDPRAVCDEIIADIKRRGRQDAYQVAYSDDVTLIAVALGNMGNR